MNRCRFSIITVCYNAENSIKGTIDSVLSQDFVDYEYIIKDGGSTDKTPDILNDIINDHPQIKLISGKDEGIYDAMNKAVGASIGEMIIFLNSGDRFANDRVLGKVAEIIKGSDAKIYYGDIEEVDDPEDYSVYRTRHYSEKNSKIWYYSLGACLCHQAMFCVRELFNIRGFDTGYKVCADKEWQLFHIKNGVKAKPLNMVIAKVLTEGFSVSHIEDYETETRDIISEYCGIWKVLYLIISTLKKSRFLHRMIHDVEQRASCDNSNDIG